MITLSVDDQKAARELMSFMLNKIDPGGKHMTASDMDEAFGLLSDEVQIVFLDIELPGMNGIQGAAEMKKRFRNLNIIFVTGHPEYGFEAHGVHPSGFLAKPVCEQDIVRELRELRFPLEIPKSPLTVQCSPFAVFVNGEPFDFKRDRTIELFAYLIYRNGAFCTNGELLGALWDGDPEKQGYLRQLVLDMRERLKDIGAEQVIAKKYGKIGINMNKLQYEGDPESIMEEFLWI
ncbi:MAG: response regulator [Eubacterium sp.]|nr:response regulator [Eubacterium sp.]